MTSDPHLFRDHREDPITQPTVMHCNNPLKNFQTCGSSCPGYHIFFRHLLQKKFITLRMASYSNVAALYASHIIAMLVYVRVIIQSYHLYFSVIMYDKKNKQKFKF